MKKMQLIYNSTTGKMEEYDPTYDITIHCKTREEKERVEKILASFRWIPVSERLPEDNTIVLVTYANGIVGTSSWHKETTYNNGFDGVFYGFRKNYGVIAWKPLPDPYEAKE